MFGYVRAVTPVLDESQARRYEGVYCGLCRTLKARYGRRAALVLNYDFVFLAMLLAPGPADLELQEKPCSACPWKKKVCWLESPALEQAADASVILTWWKLQDAIRDGGWAERQGGRLACIALRRHYQKAASLRPQFDETTRSCLHELHELEEANVPSLDRPADAFARILQAAALPEDLPDQNPDKQTSPDKPFASDARTTATAQILYHVGRWVYLTDAWDDRQEDAKTGSYNPVLARYGAKAEDRAELLRDTLHASLGVAITAFSLLDWGSWEPLLRHILREGLPAVEEAVFTGQWKTRRRMKTSAFGIHGKRSTKGKENAV